METKTKRNIAKFIATISTVGAITGSAMCGHALINQPKPVDRLIVRLVAAGMFLPESEYNKHVDKTIEALYSQLRAGQITGKEFGERHDQIKSEAAALEYARTSSDPDLQAVIKKYEEDIATYDTQTAKYDTQYLIGGLSAAFLGGAAMASRLTAKDYSDELKEKEGMGE